MLNTLDFARMEMKENAMFKKHGKEPFHIIAIHGGPGALGEMLPVCEHLSGHFGIVETFHCGLNIEAQLEELLTSILRVTNNKVLLIGHSWGAWLACIFASRHADMVKKLILIGSAPFESSYAEGIMETRFERLSNDDRSRLVELTSRLDSPITPLSRSMLKELQKLLMISDSHRLIKGYEEYLGQMDYGIFRHVWPMADRIRKDGSLLEMVQKITCPVTAIHGLNDPHPSIGVEIPLQENIKNMRFFELEKCGHYPWFEKEARDQFHEILNMEILLVHEQ